MWRSKSYKPKIQVGLWAEERELIWELLFGYYQKKVHDLRLETDSINKKQIEDEMQMIIGLRNKMQMS